MNGKLLFMLVTTLAFSVSIPSHAAIISGNDLVLYCNHDSIQDYEDAMATHSPITKPVWEGNICISYVEGTALGLLAGGGQQAAEDHRAAKPLFCPPPSVRGADLAFVTSAYMMAHPEQLTDDVTGIILRALTGAYPCK